MSLASGDLTTPAEVRGYFTAVPAAPVLAGLISRVSMMIRSELNRGILVPTNYVQQFNGTGTLALVLPEWPLLSLSSLLVSGSSMSVAPQDSDLSVPANPWGYRLQPWNGIPPGNPTVLELAGGARYSYGNQNVVVSYRAGYQVTGEVPTSATYTPLAPYGRWATDEGVTNDSGTALTATTGSTMPSAGLYVPPNPEAATPINNYLFNSTDVSAGLLVNYGFVPADIEQVAIELIGERSAYRTRIGVRSQSLAGQEMISYDTSGYTSFIRRVLSPYASVLPPAMGASV